MAADIDCVIQRRSAPRARLVRAPRPPARSSCWLPLRRRQPRGLLRAVLARRAPIPARLAARLVPTQGAMLLAPVRLGRLAWRRTPVPAGWGAAKSARARLERGAKRSRVGEALGLRFGWLAGTRAHLSRASSILGRRVGCARGRKSSRSVVNARNSNRNVRAFASSQPVLRLLNEGHLVVQEPDDLERTRRGHSRGQDMAGIAARLLDVVAQDSLTGCCRANGAWGDSA